MTATLINAFEVPPEADESFIAGWERARDFLATRHGFSVTALHRALPTRPSALSTWRARRLAGRLAAGDCGPGFPGGTDAFPSHPSLYDVVHEDGTRRRRRRVVLINPFEVPPGDDEAS